MQGVERFSTQRQNYFEELRTVRPGFEISARRVSVVQQVPGVNLEAIERMVGVAAVVAAVDNLGAAAKLAGGTEEDSASFAKGLVNTAQEEESGYFAA